MSNDTFQTHHAGTGRLVTHGSLRAAELAITDQPTADQRRMRVLVNGKQLDPQRVAELRAAGRAQRNQAGRERVAAHRARQAQTETADKAHARLTASARDLLRLLAAEVEQHAGRQVDWCSVGTLGEVEGRLRDMVNFYCPQRVRS